ncbi:Jade family PHD finger protein 3 [Intoshia linei]|uniref:Jade family PHD finger protein 3 n=1 Tax=Intoshia linei TaxID=1819745 RepID=A0A177BCC9_9BILA|nr:Jade family PHD finger protein 3 [Intoshia linei]
MKRSNGSMNGSIGSSAVKITNFEEKVPEKKKRNDCPPSVMRKTAELYEKSYISQMTLPDRVNLNEEEYFAIGDVWKVEWQIKGVQVPTGYCKHPDVKIGNKNEMSSKRRLSLPKHYITTNENLLSEQNKYTLVKIPKSKSSRYNCDEHDNVWLKEFNLHLPKKISIDFFEKMMEKLEDECHSKITERIKNIKELGIEYDIDVVCSVCLSPYSNDVNEIVFCDLCDMCVHQYCYGISQIPKGNWLCKPCTYGLKPTCVICNHTNEQLKFKYAFKSNRKSNIWAHVICALWTPDIGIGNTERVESLLNLKSICNKVATIPCVICGSKKGECVTCSHSHCRTKFHIPCAVSCNCYMSNIHETTSLEIFCVKHSIIYRKKNQNANEKFSFSEMKLIQEQKKFKIYNKFYLDMNENVLSKQFKVANDISEPLFSYWKLKRTLNCNPLIAPQMNESEVKKMEEKSLLEQLKRVFSFRRDLEKARNLCYMMKKREKLCTAIAQTHAEIVYTKIEITETLQTTLSNKNTPVRIKRQCLELYNRKKDCFNIEVEFDPVPSDSELILKRKRSNIFRNCPPLNQIDKNADLAFKRYRHKKKSRDDDKEDKIRRPIPHITDKMINPDEFYHHVRDMTEGPINEPFQNSDRFLNNQLSSNFSQDRNQSSQSDVFSKLFEPPKDIIYQGSFESAKKLALKANKWLLVSIYNSAEFVCQTINRDIWKNRAIHDFVKKNFIFWQVVYGSNIASAFVRLYRVDKYPFVVFIDPRTGQQIHKFENISEASFINECISFMYNCKEYGSSNIDVLGSLRDVSELSEADQLRMAIEESLKSQKNDDVDACDSSSIAESSMSACSGDSKPVVQSWRNLLGVNKEQSKISIRFPNRKTEILNVPSDSRIEAIVMYLNEIGYNSTDFSICANLPKRDLTTILDKTLFEAEFYPSETIFVMKL